MNLTMSPPQRVAQAAKSRSAKIVLLYDSFATAVRGQAFCDQLAGQLEAGGDPEESRWRSGHLSIPAIRHEAASAARRADFVVLSLRGDAEFSDALGQWCREWMPAATDREITLALLHDPATAPQFPAESVRSYLERRRSASSKRMRPASISSSPISRCRGCAAMISQPGWGARIRPFRCCSCPAPCQRHRGQGSCPFSKSPSAWMRWLRPSGNSSPKPHADEGPPPEFRSACPTARRAQRGPQTFEERKRRSGGGRGGACGAEESSASAETRLRRGDAGAASCGKKEAPLRWGPGRRAWRGGKQSPGGDPSPPG